jgi:hypothetical protein
MAVTGIKEERGMVAYSLLRVCGVPAMEKKEKVFCLVM